MKYLYLFLWIAIVACQSPQVPDKLDKGEKIFEFAQFLSKPELIQAELSKNKIDATAIIDACRKNNLDYSIACRFVRAVYDQPNKNYQKRHPKTEWYLERLPLLEFAQVLYYYKEPYHKTFMDVGSGNGDKLYTALCMGFEKSYGVEYEKKLHEVAIEALQPVIDKGFIEAQEGDATKLGNDYYQKADFLYMYCPLILNKPEQAKLLHRILKNMRDNTLVYEAGFVYAKEFNQLNPTGIDNGYRGFAAFKKEKGKYFKRTFISVWEEFELK
jgi:hypothetical protein